MLAVQKYIVQLLMKTEKIISEIEKYPTPKTFSEIKQTFENIIKKHENNVDIIAFSTCGAS